MAIIDEKDFLELQKQIERERHINNRLLDQVKSRSNEIKRKTQNLKIFKLLSLMLGLSFFTLTGLIVFAPDLFAVPIIGGVEQLDSDKDVFVMQDSIIKLSYRIDSLYREIEKTPSSDEIAKLKSAQSELNSIHKGEKYTRKDTLNKYAFEKSAYDNYFKTKNVYSVQIGAFKKTNILPMSRQFVNFKGFKNKDYFIYSLGNFATKEEAEVFRRQLIRLGFKDAFIVPYKF